MLHILCNDIILIVYRYIHKHFTRIVHLQIKDLISYDDRFAILSVINLTTTCMCDRYYEPHTHSWVNRYRIDPAVAIRRYSKNFRSYRLCGEIPKSY